MERLIVRNFGPIESIDIEIKDINIFIGKTSSGKSTVAKLISIFKSADFVRFANFKSFRKSLIDLNINFDLSDSTYIKYSNEKVSFELNGLQLISQNPFGEVLLKYDNFLSLNYSDEEMGQNIYQFLSTIVLNPNVLRIENKESEHLQPIFKIIAGLERVRIEATAEIDSGGFSFNVVKEFNNLLKSLIKELDVYNTLYIPAERTLLSMVAESILGLLHNDVAIANSIKDFGSKFEKARNNVKKSVISFLGVEYEFDDGVNFIKLSNNKRIRLESASSGYQSVTPLYLVLEYFLNRQVPLRNCMVVEEPESNLYPSTQKDLVEYIIAGKLKSGDKLIITTHSPYVLTTVDNLVQAYNVGVREGKAIEKVKKLVPKELWVDFDNVTCYYFENGFCRSTLDNELKTIGASNIDDVSISLGKTFDELISLKYN